MVTPPGGRQTCPVSLGAPFSGQGGKDSKQPWEGALPPPYAADDHPEGRGLSCTAGIPTQAWLTPRLCSDLWMPMPRGRAASPLPSPALRGQERQVQGISSPPPYSELGTEQESRGLGDEQEEERRRKGETGEREGGTRGRWRRKGPR